MKCKVEVEMPMHFDSGALQLGHELHYVVLEILMQTLQKDVKFSAKLLSELKQPVELLGKVLPKVEIHTTASAPL